jgi:hypothetical protein
MRKITLMLLCIILITGMFPLTACADTGPKPSVVVDFIGLEGKTYYATLLSSVKSTMRTMRFFKNLLDTKTFISILDSRYILIEE